MNWESVDHSFCESKILGIPEYINSITSLFISGFGLLGLFNTPKSNMFIDIIYSLLFIVGFGSVGYHWTGNIGWAMFDEMPMIYSIFAGIIYIDYIYTSIIIEKEMSCKKITHGRLIDTITHYNNNNIKHKYKLLVYLLGMVGFVICNTMSKYRRMFPVFFGFIMAYLYYKVYELYSITNIFLKKITINKMYFALKTILSSAIIWAGTETLCNIVPHPIFLLGHPMWHFFVCHGFYNMIQVIYYINLNDMSYKISYSYFYVLYIRAPHHIDYGMRRAISEYTQIDQ